MPNFECNSPMYDEVLKNIYSNAKTLALEKFNEMAFGEEKATFLKDLTLKMRQQLI